MSTFSSSVAALGRLRETENTVLPLDKSVDDPVDLYVGDRLIARGMLEEKDGGSQGQLVVRVTEVIDLKSGL